MNTFRITAVASAVSLGAALLVPGTAAAAAAPQGDNKDLVLITHSNGSVSLIKRDPQNKDAPYFEADRVPAGLTGADWPANQYVGSTHWWWTGQTNGTVQGFEFRREDPLADMVSDPDRTVNVDTYITPGRPNLGSNFA